MTSGEASLLERLSQAGSPRDLSDWERRDDYYTAACRVSAEDIPGLLDLVRKWSDYSWPSEGDVPLDVKEAELLPVTAWRTLAEMKADQAVEPIIDMLCELDDEFDDWACEELPHVFGKIGQSAIEPLIQLATNNDRPDYIRSIAARGLRHVAQSHPRERDRIVACLTEMMSNAREDHLQFNTTLLTELVDLGAVEAAEPIERAFAANLLDVGMMGDWESVRRKLKVEGLGLAMPANPHNTLAVLLGVRLGVGIFSERPIFTRDGINYDAEQAYYERAHKAFSKSSEAQQVIERHGDLRWFQLLLSFGVQHLGEIVDDMTPESVVGFVFDYVPRKVSTKPDSASSIICELAMFWEYLDRVHELPAAKSIADWLKSDGLTAQLKAEMSDPANFGTAKSFFMLGEQAGYDMRSEAEVARFVAVYNQSLTPNPPRQAPIVREQRVGRNAQCPCGSGKKFKKCCGVK